MRRGDQTLILNMIMTQIQQTKFKSAFLDSILHPKNIICEYLEAFGNNCQAAIVSFLDGWTYTKQSKGKDSWIRLSASYLAKQLGYCEKTIATHLKRLVDRGVLIKEKSIRLFACDTAYSYKVNEAVLLAIVGKNDCPSPVNLPNQSSNFTGLEQQNYRTYSIRYSDKNEITTNSEPVVEDSLRSEYQEVVPPSAVCSESISKQVEVESTDIEPTSPAIPNERIKQVKALGLDTITSTLRKLINDAQVEVFKDAIAAAKERLEKEKVENLGGYLRTAITEKYKPAKVTDKRQEEFEQAYDQLKAAGIVKVVETKYLNTRNNDYLVCVIDESDRGYHDEPWRDALSLL